MAALPQERFVYLGDTARVPYGSKPLAMVREFAAEITAELLGRDVKAMVIACNTASAASLPELARRTAVPLWGVVEPGVNAALVALEQSSAAGTTADDASVIGVLGTDATVAARVYQERLEAAGVGTWSRACPLFVPLVEEGLQDSDIARLVVDHYLADRPRLAALILGCTHYPLLKRTLRTVLGDDVPLIDSSQAVATVVATELARLGLLHQPQPGTALPTPPADRLEYLVTGDVDVFRHGVERLGGPQAPASRVHMNGTRRGIWPLSPRPVRPADSPTAAPTLSGGRGRTS